MSLFVPLLEFNPNGKNCTLRDCRLCGRCPFRSDAALVIGTSGDINAAYEFCVRSAESIPDV